MAPPTVKYLPLQSVQDINANEWKAGLDTAGFVNKHKALADQIVADIESGRLPVEARMPTHRDLAQRLGISVQTVSNGYKEAERRGYLKGEVGRGTFVRGRKSEHADRQMLSGTTEEGGDLSIVRPVFTQAHEEAARKVFAGLSNSDRIGFMSACKPITGLDDHRAIGRTWLRQLGLDPTPDRILITNGTAHGIFLAVSAIVRPGDVVLTEELTDHGIVGMAPLLGFTLRGLPTDEEGILPAAFEQACADADVAALVLVPTLGNPTSHIMGETRRKAIAAIAERHKIHVIEDEVYKPLVEMRLPSITEMIPDLGFFATSFSKSIMSGLRSGYLVVPPRLAARMASIMRVTTWSATNLSAEIAARWIDDGTAAKLVDIQRSEARARQRLLRDILGKHIEQTQLVSLCAWLRIPPQWTEDGLIRALKEEQIAVTGATPFKASDTQRSGIRVCVGGSKSIAELKKAISTVKHCLDQARPLSQSHSTL